MLSKHPPGPATVVRSLLLPDDALNATKPKVKVLCQKFLHHNAALQDKVLKTLTKQQDKYKRYFDRKVQALLILTIGQQVYLNSLALTLIAEGEKTST